MPNNHLIDENKIKSAEDAYAIASNLIEQIYELWIRINNWKEIEQKAKTTPFIKLSYLAIKDSGINLKKFIEKISSTTAIVENSKNLFSMLNERIDTLLNLIDSLAYLQKLAVLPGHCIYKIMKILDLENDRFTIFQIDLSAAKNAQADIEKYITESKEDIMIYNTIERIKKEVESANLIVQSMNSGKEFILSSYEGFLEMLECNGIKLEEIKFMQSAKNYSEQIEKLEEDIEKMQDSAEEFVLVYDKWQQLKRSFECRAVRELAQNEEKDNIEQGTEILAMLGQIYKASNAKNILLEKAFIEKLKEIGEKLQNVQKKIDEKLEAKRMLVPRLLFLTNTELVNFLQGVENQSFSQINMLYQGINKLLIKDSNKGSPLPPKYQYSDQQENDKEKQQNILKWLNDEKEFIEKTKYGSKSQAVLREIEGFSSKDLELTRLIETIVLPENSKIAEDLEWVQKLEHGMQKSMSNLISQAINSFTNTSLEEWVLDYPLQIVLTSVQMIISHEITGLLKTEMEEEEEPNQSHVSENAVDAPKKEKEHNPSELKIKTHPLTSGAGTIPLSPAHEKSNRNESNEGSGDITYNRSKYNAEDVKEMFSSFDQDLHFPSNFYLYTT